MVLTTLPLDPTFDQGGLVLGPVVDSTGDQQAPSGNATAVAVAIPLADDVLAPADGTTHGKKKHSSRGI